MAPVFPTTEAGEQFAQKTGAPILPAYRYDNNGVWVFCKFCGFYHSHGNADGLRCPRCGFDHATRNYPHQYYIRDTGEPVTKEMRRIHRIGQELYEKNLPIASGKHRAAKQYRFGSLALATEISDMFWEKRGICSDAVLCEILDFGVLGEDYLFAVRSPQQD